MFLQGRGGKFGDGENCGEGDYYGGGIREGLQEREKKKRGSASLNDNLFIKFATEGINFKLRERKTGEHKKTGEKLKEQEKIWKNRGIVREKRKI